MTVVAILSLHTMSVFVPLWICLGRGSVGCGHVGVGLLGILSFQFKQIQLYIVNCIV